MRKKWLGNEEAEPNLCMNSQPIILYAMLPCMNKISMTFRNLQQKPTNEDFHAELLEKLNTLNRSLMPAGRRSIPDPAPVPLPEWRLIFNEFQEKATERKKQQNIQKRE